MTIHEREMSLPRQVAGSVWDTDGSRTERDTNVGINKDKERVRMAISLCVHATVFQAEVMGMMLAARAYGGRAGRGGTVTIFSVSQSTTIGGTGSHLVWF